MSLYTEASLIMYPSGTKDSKIYSLKPVPVYGPELVVNGDFATDSDWGYDANWSIANGKATSTGGGRMLQSIPYLNANVGIRVIVTFDIVDYTSAGVEAACYGIVSEVFSGIGTYSFIGTTTNTTNLYFNNSGQGNLVGAIDNVSVKEVLVNGDLDFFRSTTKTYIDASGTRQTAAINVMPVSYENGGCGKFNFEPQRTNYLTYSEDLSNSIWVNRGFDKVGTTSGPLGTTGYEFLENNTDSNPAIYYNADATDGTPRTFGVWLKASASITIALTTNSVVKTAEVNVTTNWQFFNCTASTDMPIGSHIGGFGTITKGSGVTIYVAMPQQEEGSYPTSYIPTSGTTVTRNRDTSPTSGLSSVINSTEGVIFIEMAALANDSTNRYISINNGTSAKRIIFKFGTSSNNIAALGLGTASSFSLSYSGATITNMNKIALKYKANDCALWVNGVEVATDTTFTAYAASTLTNIGFSNFSGGGQWLEAKVQNLMVFPSALTDTELAELTTL